MIRWWRQKGSDKLRSLPLTLENSMRGTISVFTTHNGFEGRGFFFKSASSERKTSFLELHSG